MTKPFDALYADLEKSLKLAERSHQGPDKYLHGIELIRTSIEKLHIQGVKFIREGPREVEFFRQVWPAFYAKLLLYIQLHGAELRRAMVSADGWPAVIGQEEARIAAFFRTNQGFWQYYQSGAPVINVQFTRTYSRGRIFEPLALVVDRDGATLASYRAAWCLAMQGYGEWLKEERARLSTGMVSAADLGYSWGASDADLAEWLFGIQAVGAIRYKGAPADVSRLQKWARLAVGREVANIYDRARVLRNRKKERLAFTKKISDALEKKWDQAEGKFE
ncbi:RteC domain-containing protein [Flavitalea sp. BT771]|uniref:RteC domain-containing protein n=1 Tax=Flavitalea sp. BT771 TaxID=3063329 RepID=UPI0026E2160A|nr:RteC domain-containing protein [Flavitalea sp. BT771]MDO6431558.1 RteC domain-containing protein [Flavitalea sp. BT771]MDV6220466.1 RteC domain-containing protein [Flavitalea sp. BT771]